MLEYEIAAIYYFIAKTIEATPYFDEVPEDFMIPCVFYPTPSQEGRVFSSSKYATDFVMYVKFMHTSTTEAYNMAAKVFQSIMKNNRKIQLVDKDGNYLNKHFQLKLPVLKKVDKGVFQIELSWKRYSCYNRETVSAAQQIFVEMM